jgi:DNA-binding MarR family transcriptional regulator
MLGEITERMIDKNSNATRLVEKLRLKGFLKRDICKSNRRQVDITITPKGLTLLDALDVHIDEWQNDHLKIKKSELKLLKMYQRHSKIRIRIRSRRCLLTRESSFLIRASVLHARPVSAFVLTVYGQ